MHRSVKGANGETFSQLLLLQLLHHHTSKAIYIHHNDNIEEKYGLLTRAYPIFLDARYEARCRNKLRCLSRVCKFFHCAANTLIFSGFEAKNVKASGAPPQAPMGELTALPHTSLLVSGWAPPPGAPPTNRPPYRPIPRSATGGSGLWLDNHYSMFCLLTWRSCYTQYKTNPQAHLLLCTI